MDSSDLRKVVAIGRCSIPTLGRTSGKVFGQAHHLPMPQEPMLIFDKSTIQSLTVDKAVLLGTEQTLTQVLY
jgi:hypothetical protein